MTDYNTAVGAKKSADVSSGDWLVYLLRCADDSLYAGVTTNMGRRLRQHNGELVGGARYTRVRRPVSVVWTQVAENRGAAQRLEAQVKQLSRRAKERLVRDVGVLSEPSPSNTDVSETRGQS